MKPERVQPPGEVVAALETLVREVGKTLNRIDQGLDNGDRRELTELLLHVARAQSSLISAYYIPPPALQDLV
ncbi:MAG: hypothetical protein AAGN66_06975 [Acidobacteriota bacterium]